MVVYEETYSQNAELETRNIERNYFAYRLYYKDYSIENEASVLSLLMYNVDGRSTSITYSPFYLHLMQEDMTQSIFRFMSYTLLAALLMSNFFIFYAFVKRQLDEDKEKLALMSINGIKRRSIIQAYLVELIILMAISGVIVIICDSVAYLFGVHKMRYFSIFYQITPLIISITIIGTILITLLLMIICTVTINQFFKKEIIHSLKEKDLMSLKSHRKISFHHQLSMFAWRDLITNKYKLFRTTFATSFLILCLLLTFTAYKSLGNLYHEKTMGIHFDYAVGAINQKQFTKISKKYAKHISYLEPETHYFKEKIDEMEEVNIDLYYPATVMRIYDKLEPFVNLHDGTYPVDAEYFLPEKGWVYEDMHALVSRRLSDMKQVKFADQEDRVDNINQSILSWSYNPYQFYSQGNSVYIKGNCDSLLNGGNVAFTMFHLEGGLKQIVAEQSKKLEEHGKDENILNLKSGTMILNLKNEITRQEFEEFLKEEKINYISYDKILLDLNKMNLKIQEKIFVIITSVMGIMGILLIILIIANAAEDQVHKKNQLRFMKSFGYSKSFIRNWMLIRVLISMIIAIICTLILYLPVKSIYFMLLNQSIGIFEMVIHGYWILIVMIEICLVSLLFIIHKDHKEKRNHINSK